MEYYQCKSCGETFSIEDDWIDGKHVSEFATMTHNLGEIEEFINHIKKCQFMKVKDPYGEK